MSIVYTVVGSEAYVGKNDNSQTNGISTQNSKDCPETLSILEKYTVGTSSYFVTRISAKAFFNCATATALGGGSTKHVQIPRSVKVIENNAFYGSYRLQSITFQPNSCLSTIEEKAFYSLAYSNEDFILKLPSSLVTVARNAFDRSQIKTVYYGGTTVINTDQNQLYVPKVYTAPGYSASKFLGWSVTDNSYTDEIGACVFPTIPVPDRTPPPTVSPSRSRSQSVSVSPTPSRSVSATPSKSASPSASASPTPSPSPSSSQSQSMSATKSAEPTPELQTPVQCSNVEKERGKVFPIFFLIDSRSAFGRFRFKIDL